MKNQFRRALSWKNPFQAIHYLKLLTLLARDMDGCIVLAAGVVCDTTDQPTNHRPTHPAWEGLVPIYRSTTNLFIRPMGFGELF